MILEIFTDGGSKGNPGPAAIGIAFYLDKKRIHTYREDIGHATNNDAEYTAVIRALEIVKAHGSKWQNVSKLAFHSDSQLVVSQLTGLYKIKHPQIRIYIDQIKAIVAELGIPVTYTYIPREQNTVADSLVNNRLSSE
jgi:ribonuclease HI